jgi:TolB-like protein
LLFLELRRKSCMRSHAPSYNQGDAHGLRKGDVMRHLFGLFVAFLAAGSLKAMAEASPATQPAGGVLVLPFVPPSGKDLGWIGKGIQQNVVAELSPNLKGGAIARPEAQPTDDTDAAIRAARDAHAAVVIFGSTQLIGNEIRVTGAVLDTGTAKTLGTLKATGPLETLFRLEDDLANQALQSLPRTALNLRGLAFARQRARPQIIQLPGDTAAPSPSYGTLYGYSPLYPPQPYATIEPPAPPYSPYSFSYPYRFYYPYYHLFSYGDECFPFAFGWGHVWHVHARHH